MRRSTGRSPMSRRPSPCRRCSSRSPAAQAFSPSTEGTSPSGSGLLLAAIGVVAYPLLPPLFGRPWTSAEVFGIAPDPTAIATLGVLLMARGRHVLLLLPIPLLWLLLSGLTLRAWAIRRPGCPLRQWACRSSFWSCAVSPGDAPIRRVAGLKQLGPDRAPSARMPATQRVVRRSPPCFRAPRKSRVPAMRLMLVRHAKSKRPAGCGDHDRPLARRGREASRRMGSHMAGEGMIPDLVVISTARRAQETWHQMRDAFDPGIAQQFQSRVYDASSDALIEVVRETPSDVRHPPDGRSQSRLPGTGAAG